MTPTGKMTNIAPGKGGIERDPKTLASHHLPGGLELMGRAVKLKAEAMTTEQGRKIEVEIVATNVGHRVPTGFADRQLILVVHAVDADGHRVELLEGGRLPASTGKWKGMPGILYAKQLIGAAGAPMPFWLPNAKTVDTRLMPEQPDRRAFVFGASVSRVTVQVGTGAFGRKSPTPAAGTIMICWWRSSCYRVLDSPTAFFATLRLCVRLSFYIVAIVSKCKKRHRGNTP